MKSKTRSLSLMADIVASYVSANTVTAQELPAVISAVFSAIHAADAGEPAPAVEKLLPAVPIKKSVTPDYIICLEDGLKFKSLKRHLMAKYDLTPETYRQKWGLASDYPMVAPNYAKARSDLAKEMGLGRTSPKDDTIAKVVKSAKIKASAVSDAKASAKLAAAVRPKPAKSAKTIRVPKANGQKQATKASAKASGGESNE